MALLSVASYAQDVQTLSDEVRNAQGNGLYSAMERLGDRGPAAVDALAEFVMGDDRLLAYEAVQQLTSIKNPRVLAVFLRKMKTPGTDVGTMLLALGNHQNPKAFSAIVPYLSSRDTRLRLSAAYALGGIGVAEAIPLLRGAKSDPDPGVRWQARRSISDIESMMRKYPDRLKTPGWWG